MTVAVVDHGLEVGGWSGWLEPDDLDVHVTFLQSHPPYAGFEAEAPRAGRAGIDDQPRPGTLDQRLMSMAEDDDVCRIARQQFVGGGAADLMTVADVDREAIQL